MTNTANRGKRICASMLLGGVLFLAGCTPQEKTMLLESRAQDAAGEDRASTEDFTVKKIYTYSYGTNSLLGKSAFLAGCKEHEIRVVAEDGPEGGITPVGRLVDYRYGFYDFLGDSETPWENPQGGQEAFWSLWPAPEDADEETEEADSPAYYYPEGLQLSPDGNKMLVYASDGVTDTRCVWLYDLETQKPWLLFQGERSYWFYQEASFSPSGRWVAFDVTGIGSGYEIAVYDCRKDRQEDDGDLEWVEWADPESLAKRYPADHVLSAANNPFGRMWAAGLIDLADSPGILVFGEEKWSDKKEYGVEAFQDRTVKEDEGYRYDMSLFYLYGNLAGTMPYFKYELDVEENTVYYLEDSRRLWGLNMTDGTAKGPREFPDTVLDFLRLDSGDILALTTKDLSESYNMMSAGYNMNMYIENMPLYLQRQWEIQPADLYLYAADGGAEGKLLYKNLQNVIAMEYDAGNRRILLETYEDVAASRRKCIVLEL